MSDAKFLQRLQVRCQEVIGGTMQVTVATRKLYNGVVAKDVVSGEVVECTVSRFRRTARSVVAVFRVGLRSSPTSMVRYAETETFNSWRPKG